MEISGIKINLPKKVDNKNNNKPLANLNEPIQDTFQSSTKKLNCAESINEIREMKKADGTPRFNERQVLIFSDLYNDEKIDFEAVKAFKDSSDFNMNTISKIYLMKKETKSDNLYTTVNKAIEQMPKDLKVVDFKQNIFEPEKEFSLVGRIYDLDELEREVNETKTIGTEVNFDAKTGKKLYETKQYLDHRNNHQLELTSKTKDYRNKKAITQYTYYDKKEDNFLFEKQVVEKFAKDGREQRKEITTPSEIKGMFNVQYKYPDGKVEDVVSAKVDKKTGIKTIKKDFKSEDGSRTEFLYEDDPQGNRIIDYKITDENGKVLYKNSQSFEVVSDNKFISSKNNYTYEITTDDNKITIKDLHHDTETSINFEKKCKGRKDELINLLKKVPGEELFETVDSIRKLKCKDDDVLESYFNPITKNINIGDNLFVFLHELGHAKDAQQHKSIASRTYNDDTLLYTGNKKIQDAYMQERETFNETHTEVERSYIDYFTQAKGHYSKSKLGGLKEVIAETNALTNTYTDDAISCLGIRAQYLQQHFPKTIAAIKEAMEYKNDMAAMEYYGEITVNKKD
ncbi:MAG: hypothetical protein ACI4SM_06385 [Candidatus Gastranaerophilaceae bacterium]